MAQEIKEAAAVLKDFYGKCPKEARKELKSAKSVIEIDRIRMKWVDRAIGYHC